MLRNIESRSEYLTRFNDKLLDFDLPMYLEGDELRLKQVLINLVKNALKFTKRGYVRILAGYNSIQGELIVHVTDSGKGVTQDEIP